MMQCVVTKRGIEYYVRLLFISYILYIIYYINHVQGRSRRYDD
jgi:hypothetical protein